jgi:Holliday junction DNA helicase RuvA
MIGKLKGKIENIFEDSCFIDVSGVCYIVHCANNYLKSLNLGQEVSVFIHTMTKDEMPVLYGFEEFTERELFVLLTSVQGVGGRMGISLIGEIEHMQLVKAIQQENPQVLQQVSGIGNKIALRIINELKNSKKFFANYANLNEINTTSADTTYQLKQDSVSALVNLGFRKIDVINAVENIIKESEQVELEDIIKGCIAKLSR